MKLLTTAVFLCWAILLVSGDGQDVNVNPEPTTQPPTPPPTTKPTTTEPTTTKPTTTTTKPTTTTQKTTTTSTPKPTPPPTPAPNTTTPAPVTTSAPPTPAPDPKPGKWMVNGTNTTCIVLRMAAQFNVTYVNADNKTVYELITVPSDNSTTATGVCGEKEQVINIKWRPTGSDFDDSVVFHFVKSDAKSYSLHHIEAYITPMQLPKIASNGTVMMIHNASEDKTSLNYSYRCVRPQELKMMTNVTKATGFAKISDLQFQAFREDKAASFGYPEDCTVETQDVVPIAVGCALIALVVIVLVAYLVGRRRSQARGYLSM